MNDDRVSQALKSLPREQASIGFTAGVLRRARGRTSWLPTMGWAPARSTPMRWAGATAVAVLVLALGFGWQQWHHRQKVEKLELLLAEKQQLEAEFEALRQMTAQARPVVYLGSDDQVDLVLDLARFKRQGGFGSNLEDSAVPVPHAGRATPGLGARSVAQGARERNVAQGSRERNAAQGARERSVAPAQTVRPLRVVY